MRHFVTMSLLLGLLAACTTPESSADDREQLKKQLKEELRAELRAEMLSEMSRLRGSQAPVEVLEPTEPMQEAPAWESEGERPEDLPPPIAPRNNRGSLPESSGDPEKVVEVPAADAPVRNAPVEAPAEELDDAPAANEAEKLEKPTADDKETMEDDPTPSVSGLELIQLVVAERINRTERIPEAPGASFESTLGKVFAFAVIKNPNERTQVQFQWRRDGKVVHSLPLKVGKSDRGWRTWASARISRRTIGRWEVRVLDDTGALLGRRAFEVR